MAQEFKEHGGRAFGNFQSEGVKIIMPPVVWYGHFLESAINSLYNIIFDFSSNLLQISVSGFPHVIIFHYTRKTLPWKLKKEFSNQTRDS